MKILTLIIAGFLIACDRTQDDSWVFSWGCNKKECYEAASAGSIMGSPGDYHEPGDYP